MSTYTDAKSLLIRHDHGVLSTYSDKIPGYPVGSLISYMVTEDGNVICWISQIAQHTKNLNQHPKASLTIVPETPNLNKERLCLLIDPVQIQKGLPELKKAYIEKFPLAAQYLDFHDFSPYHLKIKTAYYIGGFGRAEWIDWE